MSYPLYCEEIIPYAYLEHLAEGTSPDAALHFHFIILTGGKFNELITSQHCGASIIKALVKAVLAGFSCCLFVLYNLMGGQQSAKRDEIIEMVNDYPLERGAAILEREFTVEMFKQLDNRGDHSQAGPLIASQSHVLKALFDYLSQQNKGQLTKKALNDAIQKFFDKPEKSIEYSYRIIAGYRERIFKQEFVAFAAACIDKGIETILRLNSLDAVFQKSLRDWLQTNKPALTEQLGSFFSQLGQASKEFWTLGDFKRWVMSEEHWTVFIEIKGRAYNIPLNLPCLFGVVLRKEEKSS